MDKWEELKLWIEDELESYKNIEHWHYIEGPWPSLNEYTKWKKTSKPVEE